MEQNLPVLSKKVWNLVRVVYSMLRKGISKRKLLLDMINLMIKRGKIAGKALQNLMFHHHHHNHHNETTFTTNHQSHHLSFPSPPLSEYEFSCNNSPAKRNHPVRQLRVTDSPFPLSSVDEDSRHVDEAAEQFISRFYNDLRRQNTKASFRSS